MLQRLKEVAVTGGLTTNNIAVVDEATPALLPFSPQPARYAAIGMGLGLLLGLGLAFLRENLDDSVKHPDEIEKQYGLPLLGLIPLAKKGSDKQVAALVHDDPRGQFAEAYRSMRTALQFSTHEGAPRLLMVTSCGKQEGKTTTAIALAINFAQLGKKVLLIDADMRKPSVHKMLMLPNEVGLANFLAGDPDAGALIQATKYDNVLALTAGPTSPDPVELLVGPRFLMLLDTARRLGVDHVVVDSPPLLGIADAVVLGNHVPHMVFAVKAGSTRRSAIKDSMRRLRHSGVVPMGVVFTHVHAQHGVEYGYGSYYGYHADTPASRTPSGRATGFGDTVPADQLDRLAGAGTASAAAAMPINRTHRTRMALAVGLAGALLVGAAAWWFWPAGVGAAWADALLPGRT
jgi:capsular exopolysaccharide synthesis family protein